jgi:hypothetical protein
MITNTIFFLFSKIIDGIYFCSPKYSLPDSLFSMFHDGIYYAQGTTEWFPFLSFVWLVIGIIITVEGAYWTTKLIISGVNWLRGAGEIKI